jgi:site-specific recombinase XerD
MLMTLYSTGIRRAELCRLQVTDIDSNRMMVHIRQGKGGHDRDVPLSEKLLETLRVYWRWMKPKICAPSRLGHRKIEHTIVYLHLSQKHLTAVANPLDTINVSSPNSVKLSRKLRKR